MGIKLLLNNHQAPGDTLMMTCAVRDLKKCYPQYDIMVDTNCMHLWDYNPNLTVFDEADIDLKIGPKIATQQSHDSGLHFCNAFRVCLEYLLNLPIKQGPIKPDVHLSKWEKERPPLIEGKYWLITAGNRPPKGGHKFSSKAWPVNRWQEVVDLLPDITFVQIGTEEHFPPETRLKGENVIDYIGMTEDPETGFRDLFNLFYHCQGSVGLVSLQMHLAAAFDKPCVVIAGAREPTSWEAYPFHKYLHYQGAMRCPKGDGWQQSDTMTRACWRGDIEACTNKVNGYAKCLSMITVDDVVNAVKSYYEGGRLELGDTEQKVTPYVVKKKPVFRLLANAKCYLGGERSVVWLLKAMRDKGYATEFVPATHVCSEFKAQLDGGVTITDKVTSPCDIFMVYSNDLVYGFKEERFKVFELLKAKRKFMVLNYRIGKACEVDWASDWDGYIFLNSELRGAYLSKSPMAKTYVLPPPVDLAPFLEVRPKYNQTLHMVKHSSQGDNKHPTNTQALIDSIRKHHPSAKFSFMPAPTFLEDGVGISKFSVNQISVLEFLARGSCYWYPLPEKYLDNGPRTIIEAMAAGLPVIADCRGGALDRVTSSTGWLCSHEFCYEDVAKRLSPKLLAKKGEAARERAIKEFNPDRWVFTITD